MARTEYEWPVLFDQIHECLIVPTGYLNNVLSGHDDLPDDVGSVGDHGLAVCCHCCNQLIIKPTVCSCAAFSDLDSK